MVAVLRVIVAFRSVISTQYKGVEIGIEKDWTCMENTD